MFSEENFVGIDNFYAALFLWVVWPRALWKT